MRIQKRETIAQISILKLRDYLKKFTSKTISISHLAAHFQLNPLELQSLMKELLKRQLIIQEKGKYQLTLKGRALCIARCVPPLSRAKADRIFHAFMQRVEEINRNDFYLYRVSKLFLFGSYLNPDNSDFGDIDIAFELEQKIKDVKEFLWQNEQLVEKAKQQGHPFPSLWSEISYSHRLVLGKLKNRSPYISLHPIFKEKILNTTPYKQIYP